MIEKGSRVRFVCPVDGPTNGTVVSFDSLWKSLAYIKWDDGTAESGVFVEDLTELPAELRTASFRVDVVLWRHETGEDARKNLAEIVREEYGETAKVEHL